MTPEVTELKAQLRHFKGLASSLKFEVERLEIENANLKRQMQRQKGAQNWATALDGTR